MDIFLYLKKIVRGAAFLLIAGIGLTPCIIESSEYAKSLWGAVPSPQSIAQKTTEFRQKAYELVGYKGIFGASLVILGALGLAWWKGLFGGVKKKAGPTFGRPRPRMAVVEIETQFVVRMNKILEEMKNLNKGLYKNFIVDYIEGAYDSHISSYEYSYEKTVKDHLTTELLESENFNVVTDLLKELKNNVLYKKFELYLDGMIKLILDVQLDLGKTVVAPSSAIASVQSKSDEFAMSIGRIFANIQSTNQSVYKDFIEACLKQFGLKDEGRVFWYFTQDFTQDATQKEKADKIVSFLESVKEQNEYKAIEKSLQEMIELISSSARS